VFADSRALSVETFPLGQPRLAAFLASDPNFMQFRSFGYLRVRLLLRKQREIEKLEADLEALDRLESSVTAAESNVDPLANSGSPIEIGDGDAGGTAPGSMRMEEALDALENKIKEYGKSRMNLCASVSLIFDRCAYFEDERCRRFPDSIFW
jgi:hypothetical protein